MSIVAIFSATHCRAEDVARLVGERTGYRLAGDSELVARAARRFSTTEKKLNRALAGSKPLLDGITRERTRHMAYLRAALAEIVLQDGLVYHGYATHLLPRSLNHVLRVCLVARMQHRVERAMKRLGLDEDKARAACARDDERARLWTVELTGLGPWDTAHYDMLVPMDSTTPEAVAEEIADHLRQPVLASGPHAERTARDFRIAAAVGVELAEAGHEVDVECTGGKITLIVNKYVMRLERYKREISEIARKVEGVVEAEARVGPRFREPTIYPKLDLPSKVLLVDDEKEFVHTLSERLQTRNFNTAVAYDGEQALQMVAEDTPDVMVLDLKMPGIDGLEVLRRIKMHHPRTEVIILTGHGSEAERKLAMDLGAFAYLNKPVDTDVLSGIMKDAYRKAYGEQSGKGGGGSGD